MFGRNGNTGPQEIPEPQLPPTRTLVIDELVKGRPGDPASEQKWQERSYQGHNIQTTESGGLNILRLTLSNHTESGVAQQMVVGLPDGYWRRIVEDIDISQSSPLSITH